MIAARRAAMSTPVRTVSPVADPVVLVFPTIQDGTVVRWYRDVDAARYGREMASASRNGVGVNHAPREVALAAYDAHELLRQRGDVEHLETHRRAGFPSGDVVPVPRSCCDLHGVHCEPPSELCCEVCTEGLHPKHPAGVRCVLDSGTQAPARVTVDDRFGGAPR